MTTGIVSSHTTQVHGRKRMDIILINTIKYEILLQTENLKVWRILQFAVYVQLNFSIHQILYYYICPQGSNCQCVVLLYHAEASKGQCSRRAHRLRFNYLQLYLLSVVSIMAGGSNQNEAQETRKRKNQSLTKIQWSGKSAEEAADLTRFKIYLIVCYYQISVQCLHVSLQLYVGLC